MQSSRLLLIVGALGAGLLAASLFAGGSDDGLQTSEWSNGTPREEVRWVAGERDGPCKRWYRDGTLRAEGRFDGGEMVGEWSFYREDGTRDDAKSGEYTGGRLTRAKG